MNQPQVNQTQLRSAGNQHHRANATCTPSVETPPSSPPDWPTENVLDATNNRLQELMQLLYLLSRDLSVPTDARYHVTVAQSEIALLARQMQNSTAERAR